MFALQPRPGQDPKHRLDAGKIIETAKNLANDINLHLPGTNLAILARELAVLAVVTEERGRQARRPFLAIRGLSALAIGLVFLGALVSRPAHSREVGVRYDQQHLRCDQHRVQSPGPPRRCALVLRDPRGPDQARGGLGVY